MTRTYAILDVSRRTYDEIRRLLSDAGYDHALHEPNPDGGGEMIDMHGIALRTTIKLRGTIEGCGRCGEDHEGVVVEVLTNEYDDVEWTHWFTCPVTNQPVLVCGVEHDDGSPIRHISR